LLEEIDSVEFDLVEHRRRRDAALSALVCASPQFIALYQRQARLWIELRSLRLCMHAVGGAMRGSGLSRELLSLAQASENINDRRTGFEVDSVYRHLGRRGARLVRERRRPPARSDLPDRPRRHRRRSSFLSPESRRASTPAATAGAGRGGGCFPRPARRKRAAGKSLPKEKAADSDRHHEG